MHLNKFNWNELWRQQAAMQENPFSAEMVKRRHASGSKSPMGLLDCTLLYALTRWRKPQVIVAGTNRIRGYELATGAVIWECAGLSSNVVATPVSADGIIYTGSSYDTRALFAIRLGGAAGDITNSKQVLWSRQRGTPYVPSEEAWMA